MKKLFLYSILLVFFDQLSKFLIKNKTYTIIDKFFILSFRKNFGAAFGLFQGYRWIMIVAALIVIALIVYYYDKIRFKLPLILLFSGTIGNLIDRLFFGYVNDFISIWIFSTFNLADVFNIIGAILLCFYLFKKG